MTLTLFLHVLGFVCVVLAAAGVPGGRVSLGWLGVACWMAAALL